MSAKSKCSTKVKNPCRVCLQTTTHRNGLQCMGACRKWAHFKCLDYTPGKISDIKAGIIKVACPCPDCETSAPKEYLTNPPYTCSNSACPANKTPMCSSEECPTSKSSSCVITPPPPVQQPCQPPCGTARPQPIRPSCCTPKPKSKPKKPPKKPKQHQLELCPICPPPDKRECYSSYNTTATKKSPSCSILSGHSFDTAKYIQCIVSSSDSHLRPKKGEPMMMATLQEMCNTMTRLTCQMQELMSKIAT